MSTLMSTLSVIGVIIYIVVASAFYTSVQTRWENVGFKNITWTYLDIVMAIISLPITLVALAVISPLVLVGYILLTLIKISKPDVWVDSIEIFFYRIERKFKQWRQGNKFVQKLLKPVGRKEEN